MALMARVTLPERIFPLHTAEAVDALLDRFPHTVIFKAGSGDKTVQAWDVTQRTLETRSHIAVGFIVLPADREASDRVSERAAIVHRSPQVILFVNGHASVHFDEFDIVAASLTAALDAGLPASGLRVVNDQVVSVAPYVNLLDAFVTGSLAQERFEWSYLERLAREAAWRDDESFAALDALFDNPDGRDVKPARIIAREFQSQLTGSRERLAARALRHLERLRSRPST